MRGVTLVEMLVVLAIISLSAVMFASLGGGYIQRTQAIRQAEALASSIRSARADALAGRRQVELTFNPADAAYRIGDGPIARLSPGAVMHFTGAAELFRPSGEGVLLLYADGSTSGGVIRLETASEINSIDVDWLTGSVRLMRERKK